ncbi:hypothetical protein K9K77_01570 [Candidatus Babeliales bacterium]|nr:hypothetical protein [Candidatus Babeliales bacterium]
MRKFYSVIALFVFLFTNALTAHSTRLSHNDFCPLYVSEYPFNYLSANQKEIDKDQTDDKILEIMHMSISGFGQTASQSTNQNKQAAHLGDYRGRWNMVGLLYGSVPTGQTQPALLTTAAAQTYAFDGALLNAASHTDIKDQLGHFSLKGTYRKVGIRGQFQGRILNDFVFSVKGGMADMRYAISSFIDAALTPTTNLPVGVAVASTDYYGTAAATAANIATDTTTIATNLMDIRDQIFTQMGLDGKSWSDAGAEDIDASLTWRHHFHANQTTEDENWDEFICTPHFTVGGVLGTGKEKDQAKALSLAFGNNGHHAVYVSGGMNIDFYDTVEFGFQAGGTHFFNRKINGMFIPTHEEQTGIFPYKTDVNYNPGTTWNFSVSMNAFHYSDKLSFYAQYLFANHKKDTITLVTADTAFKPEVLENVTTWTVQALNLGFNIDLTPAMTLGVAWQAPLARRGAFRTNTILLSLIGTF